MPRCRSTPVAPSFGRGRPVRFYSSQPPSHPLNIKYMRHRSRRRSLSVVTARVVRPVYLMCVLDTHPAHRQDIFIERIYKRFLYSSLVCEIAGVQRPIPINYLFSVNPPSLKTMFMIYTSMNRRWNSVSGILLVRPFYCLFYTLSRLQNHLRTGGIRSTTLTKLCGDSCNYDVFFGARGILLSYLSQ